MSVSCEEPYYKHDNPRRGIALIITIDRIDVIDVDRRGALKDAQLLAELFETLKFDVRSFKNLSGDGILVQCAEVAKDPSLRDSDCLVVALSSHGTPKEVMSATQQCPGYSVYETIDMIWGTDKPVEIGQIFDSFDEENCPDLKDKPKLFFVQCCRGEQVCETVRVRVSGVQQAAGGMQRSDDHSDITDATKSQECHTHHVKRPPLPSATLDLAAEDPSEPMEVEDPVTQVMVPVSGGDGGGQPVQMDQAEEQEKIVSHRTDIKRDYLAVYGSPVGYYAFHTKNGSPLFINLHKVLLKDHSTSDLLTMLTEVNRLVATTYESRTRKAKTNKRHIVPSISHMLRGNVFFKTDQNFD